MIVHNIELQQKDGGTRNGRYPPMSAEKKAEIIAKCKEHRAQTSRYGENLEKLSGAPRMERDIWYYFKARDGPNPEEEVPVTRDEGQYEGLEFF